MKRIDRTFCMLVLLVIGSLEVPAQTRTVARLFWQDDSTAKLRWGDLKKTADSWTLEAQEIPGFPKLDVAEQGLVQMEADQGIVLLGVRDESDGAIGSGWIAIDSGAVEEPHGDHSHWPLVNPPRVLHTLIDAQQGNPAHLYRYGRTLVMANDKKNGFTLTSAKALKEAKVPPQGVQFMSGGNGHITLAVVENQVAYATWIAREGDESGRVDVVGLGKNAGRTYSFKCPTGGLHGATAHEGKAFFAPVDGVCWVAVDPEADDNPQAVIVHHLSLGKSKEGKPLRTGSFTTFKQHVLFTSGKGEDAKLCSIDATAKVPAIVETKIPVGEQQSLSGLECVQARTGKKWGILFRESKEGPNDDQALLVDLDPNDDGQLADARLAHTIKVGANKIEGHSGHHQTVLLPDRRHVAITNPGDGSIWVVSLNDASVVAKFQIGGTPTKLVGIGG
jgi:hypothetical protein